MSPAPLHIAGERLMLDPAGCVWWPRLRMLIAADWHLEKGSAHAARGQLLPPYDTSETLERLLLARRRYNPDVLVSLGDAFHDAGGPDRLSAPDRDRLGRLTSGLDMVWILGNHDPTLPADLPGRVVEALEISPFILRHMPGSDARPEIVGHLHPKARVTTRGQTISRPCFAASETVLILPAIGRYTGGLDTRAPAIAGLFPRGAKLFLQGKTRLYQISQGPSPRAFAKFARPSTLS